MAERKPKPDPSGTTDSLNFEKSLKQLESLVKRLEDEDLPLDQALKLFAEGQKLARACETQLKAAENEVRKLLENPAGEIVETAFEGEADAQADEANAPRTASSSHPSAKPNKAAADDDLPF